MSSAMEAPVSDGDRKSDFDHRLTRETADTIAHQLSLALPMNCILALSAFAMMDGHEGYAAAGLWLGCMIALNGLRFAMVRYYLNSRGKADAGRYLQAFCAGSTLSGFLWIVVPLGYIDMQDLRSFGLLVILCGLAAGATVQGAAYAWMSIGLVTPMLLAAIAALLRGAGLQNHILAFDVMLLLSFIIRSSVYSQRAFRETLSLRHRATDLAAGLQELANNDPLTGLPNRAFFAYALTSRLETAATNSTPFFMLLVDLDDFKSINDTLGHTAGDLVLREVASRLSRSDGGRHAVTRLGGDEFAILLADGCDDEEACRAADRIVAETCSSFTVGGPKVNIRVSAGLAKFPDDGTSDEALLARADLALYAAKNAGRQTWRRFDATLLEAANVTRDIEQDLPQALVDGSLQVWFQPQVATSGRRLIGFEALIRWNHPRHGWLAPPLIVKAALRMRESEALTGFVLDHACRFIKDLATQGLGDLVVAVNVSPSELDLYSMPSLVRRHIETWGIEAARLELEITEEALVAGNVAATTLATLAAMGVRLAIDDFGTGCSSIAYLRTQRFDRIKIDRSFVSGFAAREGDRILVQAILGIGRSFGIEVIAEGVETEVEAALLESFGCRSAQGYLFGRAMELTALRLWIEDWRVSCETLRPSISLDAIEDAA